MFLEDTSAFVSLPSFGLPVMSVLCFKTREYSLLSHLCAKDSSDSPLTPGVTRIRNLWWD